MEINQLIIASKNSSERFTFNNKINLVDSTLLSDELLKGVKNLENTEYILESHDNVSIGSLFQIKVHIAKTGSIFVNWKSDTLDSDTKERLIGEISTLKDGVEPSFETQKEKIKKVLEIVGKYNPVFVCYNNAGDFLFTRSTFEEIAKDIEINFPILLLLASLDFVESTSSIKTKRVFKQKSTDNPKSAWNFKESLAKFKSLDYVFFGAFSLFIAFGLVASIFEIKNGEGLAAFLLILTIVFIITLFYATYRASKENEYFSYNIKDMWVPMTYIVLGVALGIVIGFLVTTYLIKLKDGVTINNVLLYGLTIPGSLAISIAGLYSPLLTNKIVLKIKKKK